jgi:soluble lytic murein transglycosylase-like protein
MKLFLFAFLTVLLTVSTGLSQSDAELRDTLDKDRSRWSGDGQLMSLSAGEHIRRGYIYLDNRHFTEAKGHFKVVLDTYSADPLVQRALFGMGRSLMWERSYAEALPYFTRVAREFPGSKDGREGLYFAASCSLRIGKNDDAAKAWQQYTVMYPKGERIEGSYVNSIDALREAGRDREADAWVETTRQRFPGTATETNALHARLRMQINRGRWADAEATAALMQAQAKFVGSLTSLEEVKYLRAVALENGGKKQEAAAMYASIPETRSSYYGGLAADKLRSSSGRLVQPSSISSSAGDFPAAFRDDVLRESKKRGLDPRFILAIMKQESSFRPGVKSGSAARGLLQLTIDTAMKYRLKANYLKLQPDDLYVPRINIAIGAEYIADLKAQFNGLYEAIAASYNGGEDNAARWLSHSKPKNPGVFASEVGFAETKNYVFKVMTNYRVYRSLYDENLVAR